MHCRNDCWYGECSSSVRSSLAERIRDRGGEQRRERVELVAGQQVVDHDEAVGAERFDLFAGTTSLIVPFSR